jgi:hypothetical protein
MKKFLFILLLIFILFTTGILIKNLMHREGISPDLTSITQTDTVSNANLNVTQISFSEWNTPSGIPYSQVPGANLGATSFQIIDEKQIAYLCNSTSEIIISNITDGKSVKKFPVSFAPRDFVYDKGFFYVLSEYLVTVYDESGMEHKKYPFPATYPGVERLTRNNDATYLLLPSGNSLMIENCGTPVHPVEYSGIITGTGQFIKTQITGNNTYSIKIQFSEDTIIERTFSMEQKVAGVFVTGATENRIVLDVQTFISENPVAVERVVTSIGMNNRNLGSAVSSRKVPVCYYVISNRDFYVAPDGNIYNMMTSPQGVFVFSLTETKSADAQDYPASLTETRFQSNEHLIKLDS